MRIKPLTQIYENYTTEDFKVWETLYVRQLSNLKASASALYLKSIDVIGFNKDEIPDFKKMNMILEKTTGWQLVVAKELVPNDVFFDMLSKRIFPATCWLRSMEELDYLEEPDMFHDVFGHVPLLSHPAYAAFMQNLGKMALRWMEHPEIIDLLARVYWYTIEFGMISENDQKKVFGSGIMSSVSETENAVGVNSVKLDFDIQAMIDLPYRSDIVQPVYFVIDSFEHLMASDLQIETVLKEMLVIQH